MSVKRLFPLRLSWATSVKLNRTNFFRDLGSDPGVIRGSTRCLAVWQLNRFVEPVHCAACRWGDVACVRSIQTPTTVVVRVIAVVVLVEVLVGVEGLVGVVGVSDVTWDTDRRDVHARGRLVCVALGEVIFEEGLGSSSEDISVSDGVAGMARSGLGRHLVHRREAGNSIPPIALGTDCWYPNAWSPNNWCTGNWCTCVLALQSRRLNHRSTRYGVVATAGGALSLGNRRARLDRCQSKAAGYRKSDHSVKSHSIHSCARDALL